MGLSDFATDYFGKMLDKYEVELFDAAGLQHVYFPRYRSVETKLKNGKPVIIVRTRSGGGNREEYEDEHEEIERHETYMHDKDDWYDSTYAKFYFSVKPEYVEFVLQIIERDK